MTTQHSPSAVVAVTPATAEVARQHFARRLELETDCADVFHSMKHGQQDFVLVDVRSAKLYAKGHIDGAINIPHAQLTEDRLQEFAASTIFVVYCAGPHCNGANRGALRLAQLGRPVKEMIGGVQGWLDEGHDLIAS